MRNYTDNSTEAGFQFTFYCEICRESYKSDFMESKSRKKERLFRSAGRLADVGASLAGKRQSGYSSAEKAADVLAERFEGMSPDWLREHDAAFELAQSEAKKHFHRCSNCTRWVCENDWNDK